MRSIPSPSRTATPTASAICRASSGAWIISGSWAAMPCGSTPALIRPSWTRGMTSGTIKRSRQDTEATRTSAGSLRRPTDGASGCCWIWWSATPRISTPGSAPPPGMSRMNTRADISGPTASLRAWRESPISRACRIVRGRICSISSPVSPPSTTAGFTAPSRGCPPSIPRRRWLPGRPSRT